MFVVALFALPIAISDWCYRRIPNIYLIFMGYLLFLTRTVTGLASLKVLIVASFAVILLTLLSRMGAGDAKLLIVELVALNPANYGELLTFAICLYVGALIQITLMVLLVGSLPRSIPLAVGIFIGTALYLAANSAQFLQQYADALVNSW